MIEIPPFTSSSGHAPASHSTFYFGVFDGHGGGDCSVFLRDRLHRYIEESARLFDGNVEQKIATQTQLATAWKDTVGGYFKRFKPDFSGRGEAGEMEAVLTYAFLRADLDFITRARPSFMVGDNTRPEGGVPKSNLGPPKSGSTASIALISTP